MTRWRICADKGGTFTDIVARSPNGSLIVAKVPSQTTTDDPIIIGIRQVLGLKPQQPIPNNIPIDARFGSTVATNALLERKGAPTLFVATQGFADLLRIGRQNRPNLFALNIQQPIPLYTQTLEARERIQADGTTLIPLDENALRADLIRARNQGMEACAIAFLHADRWGNHERRAGTIAREVGFQHVALSQDAAPTIRIIPRASTAVADATLAAPLRRHVAQVRQALPQGARIGFMTSSGGLAQPEAFHGRDAALSGPAGGVIGAMATARTHGWRRAISFDMGGTSTDVACIDDTPERLVETRVGGAILRAPALAIHTVAAGGGSVLRFHDGTLAVGPRSAGADPGPACYGRGGPLTITDANLMTGRLEPSMFPRAFGPRGDSSLNPDATREAFHNLARRAGYDAPEDCAEAFLGVANDIMARALRSITLERGHDPSRFVLNAFGGCGGQHACALADACDIRHALAHPLAGVLSAYGAGMADALARREQSIAAPLDAALLARLRQEAATLGAQARGDLSKHDAANARLEARLNLRYAEAETLLDVPLSDLATMRAEFLARHRRLFGFAQDDGAIVADSLRVEARAASVGFAEETIAQEATNPATFAAEPWRAQKMRFGGRWHEAKAYRLDELDPHATFAGPALALSPHATLVVEKGWRVTISPHRAAVLARDQGTTTHATKTQRREPNPMSLALFNNLFMSIAEDMGTVLERAAHSVNIKERLDFSCAVFDAQGALVANAPHMPVHLGSMGASVREVLAHAGATLQPEDSWALNDPYRGGAHLPDVTIVAPFFADKADTTPTLMLAARGHHADIGGMTPGSMPASSTTLAEEGCIIDMVLATHEGTLREDALREALAQGDYPARNPDQNIADLRAQIAACRRGQQALARACLVHGRARIVAHAEHVQHHAAKVIRRVIAKLRPAAFAAPMDNGATIRVRIEPHSNGSATIDFTGTSAQTKDNFNAPLAVTRASVLYAIRCLAGEDIPLNEGCLAPITLIAPEGTIVNPRPGAAVAAGNVETSQIIVDALLAALDQCAAAQGTMNNLTFGNATHQHYETICGGAGAGPTFAGASAVQTHMTNSRLTDPEMLETRYPVVVERFSLRRGSGGRGANPGGDGTERVLRFLAPMRFAMLSGRRRHRPFGLHGGGMGKAGETILVRADGSEETLPACAEGSVNPGDRLIVRTPGGGGWGSAPTNRT